MLTLSKLQFFRTFYANHWKQSEPFVSALILGFSTLKWCQLFTQMRKKCVKSTIQRIK
jgi:hypothetical protein